MRFTFACLVVLALVVGCAKQPGLTAASAPPPTGTATAGGAPPDERTLTGTTPERVASTPGRGLSTTYTPPARPKPGEFVENAALEDIHFDFDRYDLRDTDRLILDRHASWMKEHAGTLLLIEGHCDERGTAEYNISLGERRAKTTANYLTSRGVGSDRITIVSYGEERPVCRDHGEACWSRNRRAHFLVKQP